ncbi:MAG TPA: hypothetical protein VGN16_01025 [Acidobacteriaceae bacterium]|jgi:hypothetical protein
MLARILLIEFGVFLLGLILALGYQIGQRLHARGAGWPAESLMLLAAVVGVGGTYMKDLAKAHTAVPGMMPAISSIWVEAYGLCCALYLLAKGLRVWRLKKV